MPAPGKTHQRLNSLAIAAAVLLDGDGKLADVMLDELEVEVTADGKGVVTMPTDYRTKRQKGGDYPLDVYKRQQQDFFRCPTHP